MQNRPYDAVRSAPRCGAASNMTGPAAPLTRSEKLERYAGPARDVARHKRSLRALCSTLLLLAGCAGKPVAPSGPAPIVAPDSVVWTGDPALAPFINKPMTPQRERDAYQLEIGMGHETFVEHLADAVEDTTAPWLVRVNALGLLARRAPMAQLPVFAEAMHDREEVVRIAVMSNMSELIGPNPETAIQFLVKGLEDASPRVQSAALTVLGERDVAALRNLLARTTNKDIRTIVVGLLQAAEEHGAALVATDSSGTLERTTATGIHLAFRPTTRWPNWDAAIGDLMVTPAGGKPILVASGVEEVGNVVPAFFTADGKTLVYEVNREVHTRDMQTGQDKKLADGIAPRIMPFTNDVIYMVEVPDKRMITANNVVMRYNVMRVPLTGGTATAIGDLSATAANNVKGAYSAVRWARIIEEQGNFALIGDNLVPFTLPSPFGS